MYDTVSNPIPKSNLFITTTLDIVAEQIERLPAREKANAYLIFQMTLNACHQLVEEEILSKEVFAS